MNKTTEALKQEPVISDVFFICDAYESGFGHGAKNDGLNDGAIFANKQQGEAYELGYAEGLKRSKREPVNQEPVAWRVHPFDYGVGHKGVYAMTMRLEQVEAWNRKGWIVEPLYAAPVGAEHFLKTIAALREGIATCRAEALEEAAKVCDDYAAECAANENWEAEDVSLINAAAIRGLK